MSARTTLDQKSVRAQVCSPMPDHTNSPAGIQARHLIEELLQAMRTVTEQQRKPASYAGRMGGMLLPLPSDEKHEENQ